MPLFVYLMLAIQALMVPMANGPVGWPAVNPAQVVTCTGDVSGKVYHDLNRNGICDAGEPGVGVVVEFRQIDGEGGMYAFSDSQTGEYTATVVCADYTVYAYNVQTWLTSQTVTKTVTADGLILSIAVNFPTSFTSSGTVYIDGDGDGDYRRNSRDRTVPEAVVTLTGEGITGTMTTTTNYDGWYSFRQLPAGNYRVVAETPTLKGEKRITLGVMLSGQADIAVLGKNREYLPLVIK